MIKATQLNMAKYSNRHFAKNDVQEDSSMRNRAHHSLSIREVQIKTCAPNRMAEIVRVGTAACWARTCSDQTPCALFFGRSNSKTTWGKGLAAYYKNKHTLNYDLAILLGVFPSIDAQKACTRTFNGSISHDSPQL